MFAKRSAISPSYSAETATRRSWALPAPAPNAANAPVPWRSKDTLTAGSQIQAINASWISPRKVTRWPIEKSQDILSVPGKKQTQSLSDVLLQIMLIHVYTCLQYNVLDVYYYPILDCLGPWKKTLESLESDRFCLVVEASSLTIPDSDQSSCRRMGMRLTCFHCSRMTIYIYIYNIHMYIYIYTVFMYMDIYIYIYIQ